MNKFIRHILPVLILIAGIATTSLGQDRAALADSVKREFLHAWNGYKQFAWGHDELRPLSKTPHDWYGSPLYLSPVDAFDTMFLMGLTKEAGEAKQIIFDSLSFDRNVEVRAFEIIIRELGGLLSAYELDGDKRLLLLAEDLGKRLLPIYESKTGMPYRKVNLKTGKASDPITNPAEIGTAMLEFGTLSRLTGNPVYYSKAKNASVQVYNRRSKIGLVGTWINVETGEWVDKSSHISGGIDSYYEYLLKASILFNDKECKRMWEESISAINRYLADTTAGDLWYAHADMDSGKRTGTYFGSLDAFFPAVLALSGDTLRARKLEASCFTMWTLNGIEPEELDYTTLQLTDPHYFLRPEIIESAYYLYHFTHDVRYLKMGERFFNGLVLYCRTDDGYACLKDVRTKEKEDSMESFFFAETLKYLYLIFAPESTLPFAQVIFNTEAHPLYITR